MSSARDRDRLRAEHGFVADVGHLTVFGEHEDWETDPGEDARNTSPAEGVDPV